MVGLVSLMTAMLCADQNLLAPNVSSLNSLQLISCKPNTACKRKAICISQKLTSTISNQFCIGQSCRADVCSCWVIRQHGTCTHDCRIVPASVLCFQMTSFDNSCRKSPGILLLTCLQLSAAAAYFGLDDRQKDTYLGGYLMAAFFLVGAPAALVVRVL